MSSQAQIWLHSYFREKLHDEVIVEMEYKFCAPERQWRFDLAVIDNVTKEKWAFEIEGGIFVQGRHSRGAGMRADLEKYNRASAMGWQIFRFLPEQVLKGEAKKFIEEHLL